MLFDEKVDESKLVIKMEIINSVVSSEYKSCLLSEINTLIAKP